MYIRINVTPLWIFAQIMIKHPESSLTFNRLISLCSWRAKATKAEIALIKTILEGRS